LDVLSVEDLSVLFELINGRVRAVNGVSYHVKPGEAVGIGGESGCGKSVTISAAMGLLPAEAKLKSGSMLYTYEDGHTVDIAQLDRRGEAMRGMRKTEMSLIFQEPSAALSPVHTIYGQMQEALKGREQMSKAEKVAACVEALSLVGIRHPERWVHEYSFRLSGGMAQRVMIAQAMIKEPRILFADEPTTALDVTVQAQVLKLLDDLRQEKGIAMVYITHNMGILAHMTERIYIMYLGKIVETAKTREIFKHPLHPYTQGLIGCTPALGTSKDTQLFNIPGSVMQKDAFAEGCSFHSRCSQCIKGICDVCPPPNIRVDDEHVVSCHLYDEHADADRRSHE
jgi:peptide/nickel transport system ATP-binding protein